MKFSVKSILKVNSRFKAQKELWMLAIGLLLSSWIPINWFRAKPHEFKYMWGGGGDGLITFSFIESLAKLEFPINKRLGYPEGLNWGFYPNGDWMLTVPAALINNVAGVGSGALVIYILSFPLSFLFSYLLSRELKLGFLWSFNVGLIFTFLPWHFARLGHIMLATQFAVASGLLLLVRIFISDKISGRRNSLVNVLLLLTSTLSGIYFALFTSLLFGASLLWKFFQGDSYKRFARIAYFIGFNFVTLFGQIPFRMAIPEGENPLAATQRQVWESYLYGGRLIYALSPSPNTGIGPLRPALEPLKQLPVETESGLPSNFGTLAVSFFALVSLVYLFYVLAKSRANNSQRNFGEETANYLLLMTLLTIFLFITFGLNLVFAYFISPQIRAWNRITPLLQLLIVLLGSIALKMFLDKLKLQVSLFRSRFFIVLIALGSSLVILADQVNGIGSMRGLVDQGIQRHLAAEQYNQIIDEEVPENCAVFQLPIIDFPEVGPRVNLPDYEHFLPALVGIKRAWSYGAVKNTGASQFASNLLEKSPRQLVELLRGTQFCILHLDLRGYENDKIKSQLIQILGEPIATGFEGNWFAFKIS